VHAVAMVTIPARVTLNTMRLVPVEIICRHLRFRPLPRSTGLGRLLQERSRSCQTAPDQLAARPRRPP
jgi:hypothetical protein